MMIITFIAKGLLYLMMKKLWKHSIIFFLILRTTLSLAVNHFITKPSVELFTVHVKRASEEYKKHPSIVYITNKMTSVDNPKFKLRFFPLNETFGGIEKLPPKKAFQAFDMLAKIIKENQDLLSFCIFHNFSNAFSSCSFPTVLTYAHVGPALKRIIKQTKKIIDLLVSSQM